MRDEIKDYFILKVRVKHQLRIPSESRLIDSFSSESSILIQVPEFLQNGSCHMQIHFPSDIIPDVLMHDMMPKVILYAEAITETRRWGFLYERPDFRLFSLNLDIIILRSFWNVDEVITDMVIEESMGDTNNVKMVPASESAIESLESVKLENQNNVADERCSICLTEFEYGEDAEQVSSMPCKHVYHQECLVHWLKTSHLCPLCRYAMPI
ncbi:hypothetical protein PIB30_039069 [Stylosanthes scabra]|uniref:RING-type E3 ubiquitin transferase n=1 Tax=Stylosanthes scabra TaxID=79078 RepID=A0ABU6VCM9_9FABA|nr:hypothetical protein [Stylosanthes scabra]